MPFYLVRLREEAREVYREAGSMSLDSLQRQPAMENAVREGQRLHPPLILLIRKVLEPLQYEGSVVLAGEDRQHHDTLIAFGGGKHARMGKNFAYMQFKAIWTVLLDRFDFMTDPGFPRPNYGSWMTGPETPGRVGYRRRPEPSVFR